MKFVFASDSFKESLTQQEINELLKIAALQVFPECETAAVLIADGGEGTVNSLVQMKGGRFEQCLTYDPLMNPIQASFGIFNGCAVIETAAASGLPLVPKHLRNPLKTTSYGTGVLMHHALKKGYRKLFVGLGGSASIDGGMGALKALGTRFFDRTGHELSGTGADLERVFSIDTRSLLPELNKAEITVLYDVDTPLTGKNGAVRMFGTQKGGTPEILNRLECGMINYENILQNTTGTNLKQASGAGAAGGLGAAFYAILHSKMQAGIETILNLIEFDELLKGADLVITGEGRIDGQTVHGKAAAGVAARCKKHGIPAAALVGAVGSGAEAVYNCGIESIMPIVNAPMPLPEALERAKELYLNAAIQLMRFIKIGIKLQSS